MKRKCLKHIMAFVVLFLVWLQPITAYAYEGSVVFGSESYSWYTGKICPIGVYMECDTEIGEYEIWMEYDENVLQYLSGATSQAGNQLYIKGTGASNKTMLHFEPIVAGSTSIRIIAANCVTAGNQEQNLSSEAVEIALLSQVPVTLYESGNANLQQIAIDGVMLEGFTPETYEYYVEVDMDVNNLNVTYVPADLNSRVNISDTSLVDGENIITLTVQADTGETMTYTILAERKDLVVVPEETISAETTESFEGTDAVDGMSTEVKNDVTEEGEIIFESEQTDEANAEMRTSMREGFLKNPLLWCLTSAVAIFIIAYFVYFLLKRKDEIIDEAEGDEEFIKIIDLDQEVIKIKNVTMRFRLAQEESSSLKEYMIRTVKGQNHYHYLTALDNISFDVKQGDVVGIIGTNGSGKSTLLKIISGSLTPTEGHVEVDKRKIQMLTLGTGFDMELTAKENVYLNGAIIGYTREYIDEKYDDIVAFAELEGFMDERMKNFSSGMVSRLGFAIATMRDAPDILILDEVLSVGDMFFKEKSMNRIREMIHGGATVLIVSHSPDVIINNCNRAVWIEKGVMQMIGDPKEVCEAYKNYEIKTKNL